MLCGVVERKTRRCQGASTDEDWWESLIRRHEVPDIFHSSYLSKLFLSRNNGGSLGQLGSLSPIT